ncbi:ankyrin repeat-containing domain protein [Ilyonectria robusta]|uniref:ankyrin repeat-containing domain protein n=1 Tax=Ilyonectria robusta TaxID=1079257 RepID=UPI001E8D717A|nr:ankyrin repeat-containing domain protein [Ilyonectria robusta]KAH8661762.1 ankyrin repeat-containing domain protein [Ilyonectria robusta]
MHNTTGSSSSGNTLVDDTAIPIVWYNDSSNVRGPTDDLIHAVLAGNVARVQHLSMRNFSIPAADSWVIYQACLQGLEMMRALSMNPMSKLNRVMPWQMGDRTLHFLLRTPSDQFLGTKICAISFLIQNGAHPLEQDRQGNNALHILAEISTQSDADGVGIMRVLLDKTERAFISKSIRDACLSKIDSRNIPLEDGEGCTALMTAVMCDNAGCVQTLLEHGASPHLVGPLYQPPLYFAVSKNFVTVAKLLLQHGAIINPDIEAKARSPEMVEVLRRNS